MNDNLENLTVTAGKASMVQAADLDCQSSHATSRAFGPAGNPSHPEKGFGLCVEEVCVVAGRNAESSQHPPLHTLRMADANDRLRGDAAVHHTGCQHRLPQDLHQRQGAPCYVSNPSTRVNGRNLVNWHSHYRIQVLQNRKSVFSNS